MSASSPSRAASGHGVAPGLRGVVSRGGKRIGILVARAQKTEVLDAGKLAEET